MTSILQDAQRMHDDSLLEQAKKDIERFMPVPPLEPEWAAELRALKGAAIADIDRDFPAYRHPLPHEGGWVQLGPPGNPFPYRVRFEAQITSTLISKTYAVHHDSYLDQQTEAAAGVILPILSDLLNLLSTRTGVDIHLRMLRMRDDPS